MRLEFLAYVALCLVAVLCGVAGKWEPAQTVLLLAILLAVVDLKGVK